jgi:hypothetical protein
MNFSAGSILKYLGGLALMIGIVGTILGMNDYVLVIKGVTLPQINLVVGILITVAGAAMTYFGWKMEKENKEKAS